MIATGSVAVRRHVHIADMQPPPPPPAATGAYLQFGGRQSTLASLPHCGRFVLCAPAAGAAAPAPLELAEGEVVCDAAAATVSVVEEWKKRVCAGCFEVAAGRLELHCLACDQAYYCSAACKAEHWETGGAGGGGAPHSQLCGALQRFSGLKVGGSATSCISVAFACFCG